MLRRILLTSWTISAPFIGKPVSPGPLNSSAKKQRRVLETMVTSEGMCSLIVYVEFVMFSSCLKQYTGSLRIILEFEEM